MNKEDLIIYLNKIRPFINLKSVCDSYNSYSLENSIDYNNLRVVLNGLSLTRVSEEKLQSFVMYIKNVLCKTVFEFDGSYEEYHVSEKTISAIIEQHCHQLTASLVKEIKK